MEKTITFESQAVEGRCNGTLSNHRSEDTVDRSLARRSRLRNQHAQRVAQLMEDRADLRGVHPLADFVHEAIRWTA